MAKVTFSFCQKKKDKKKKERERRQYDKFKNFIVIANKILKFQENLFLQCYHMNYTKT